MVLLKFFNEEYAHSFYAEMNNVPFSSMDVSDAPILYRTGAIIDQIYSQSRMNYSQVSVIGSFEYFFE